MISFELSDEQKMVRDTVAGFAGNEVRPAARASDETGVIPFELLSKAWDLGLVRGCLPENVGGYGDPRIAVTGAIVAEELAYGDLSFAVHALAPRLLAFPVLEMGTEEQQHRCLSPLAGDQFVAATAALMEPCFAYFCVLVFLLCLLLFLCCVPVRFCWHFCRWCFPRWCSCCCWRALLVF